MIGRPAKWRIVRIDETGAAEQAEKAAARGESYNGRMPREESPVSSTTIGHWAGRCCNRVRSTPPPPRSNTVMPTDVPKLLAALAAAEPAERARAAEQLASLGPDARAAAVSLARACGDQDEKVREWAVAALEELGAPPVADLAVLASLLGDQSADVGYWAATLLGRLGEDAAPAVPALASALSGSKDIVGTPASCLGPGQDRPSRCRSTRRSQASGRR